MQPISTDYMIPGKEHLPSYVDHLVHVNHEHKIIFVTINKNGSTHVRSVIDFPVDSNSEPPGFYDLMEISRQPGYLILIILREPASRLASSITHDIFVPAHNRRDPLLHQGNIGLITFADMFLEDFKSFDLKKFLRAEHEAGLVIPAPADCSYHGRIQFNKCVVEFLKLPNTIVFHVDNDLSDNLLYFLEVHRPQLYEQYINKQSQKHSDDNNHGEAVSREEIHQLSSKLQNNNRFQNKFSFIYYTLMPYLTDPRIQPNKIYTDYQDFYARDIEMYREFNPKRYFRRP